MAEDARISTALPNHPKTKKLRKRVGIAGCWSLVCLFLWVASNRWNGDLAGLSDEDIELASDWDGDSGVFVAALLEVRFLDGDSGTFRIHDWAEHNPWAAGRGERIESAKHAAGKRWHAGGMRSACADAKSAMPPTQPNPTKVKTNGDYRNSQSKPIKGECSDHLGMGVTDHGFCNGCEYGFKKVNA